jgi:putative tricarboxylic transport membrane protein
VPGHGRAEPPRHRAGALAGPWQIAYALAATLAGIMIGLLPGLSATLGVALFTTLTIKMAPTDAILVLICVYVGAIYGGSRTAILLNIPGTAANAAACLDGNMLARQGRAGRAMGIATTGSVAGSLFGVVCLAMFTPLLAETALRFGAFEFFWLGIVGVMMSGTLTGASPVKGWLMGLLGLFVATIGLDPIHAYERFTFGQNAMTGGIGLIPALVGAFGFAEILTVMGQPRLTPMPASKDSVLPKIADLPALLAHDHPLRRDRRLRRHPARRRRGHGGLVVVRGGQAGQQGARAVRQGLGGRPGRRRDRRQRRHPGAPDPGPGARHPGSAPAAVLMAAMIIHGAQPGPMLMVNQPQFIYDVVGITLVATLAILLFGLVLVRPILWVLRVPREIIMPIVFLLCVLGSYSITQRLFDVWVMLATGLVCYVLRRRGFPVAPFVLGLVLGDIVDKSLRRGLVLSDGSLLPFFTRPISAVLALLVLAMLLAQLGPVQRWLARRAPARTGATP